MRSRFTKALLSLTAVAALAVPAVAQARNGSDDPAGHVRHEHHQLARTARAHDAPRHQDVDGPGDGRHGGDDGPGHR
jgi:Ni/Co efflux regulator RcnB